MYGGGSVRLSLVILVSTFEHQFSDALLPGLSVPVGRHLDDGLNYPTNPRFDNAGRWQRRKEWPSDLQ